MTRHAKKRVNLMQKRVNLAQKPVNLAQKTCKPRTKNV